MWCFGQPVGAFQGMMRLLHHELFILEGLYSYLRLQTWTLAEVVSR